MAAQPEIYPQVLSTLLKAYAGTVSVLLVLVSVLYHNLKETDKDQQGQLDDGADEFKDQAIDITKLKKDIESIREWVKVLEDELDIFELKRLKDHEEFLVMKDQHKRNHGEDIK